MFVLGAGHLASRLPWPEHYRMPFILNLAYSHLETRLLGCSVIHISTAGRRLSSRLFWWSSKLSASDRF
jgi:hypothetical protein